MEPFYSRICLLCDKDGNGRVDREEMLAALTAEGVPGIADEMDSLWDVFDPEGAASVDEP